MVSVCWARFRKIKKLFFHQLSKIKTCMKPIYKDVVNQRTFCKFMRLSEELSAVFHHRRHDLPARISSLASCQTVARQFLYIPFIFNQLVSGLNHLTVTIINSCKIPSSIVLFFQLGREVFCRQ